MRITVKRARLVAVPDSYAPCQFEDQPTPMAYTPYAALGRVPRPIDTDAVAPVGRVPVPDGFKMPPPGVTRLEAMPSRPMVIAHVIEQVREACERLAKGWDVMRLADCTTEKLEAALTAAVAHHMQRLYNVDVRTLGVKISLVWRGPTLTVFVVVVGEPAMIAMELVV